MQDLQASVALGSQVVGYIQLLYVLGCSTLRV